MSDVPDLSKFTVISREEVVETLMQKIHWRLRYLKWAPWRKHMTAEDVLKQTGINVFADEIAEHALAGCVILRQNREDGPNPFARLSPGREVHDFSQPLTITPRDGGNDEEVGYGVAKVLPVIVWDREVKERRVVPKRWGSPMPRTGGVRSRSMSAQKQST